MGRPTDVYCNGWIPKYDNLFHEVMVTEVLMYYRKAKVVRGYAVDKIIRPDAELDIANHRFLLELDTGRMTHRQLRYKWFKRYHGVTDYMLFVSLGSEDRLQRVIKNAKRVREIGLFTTFSRLEHSPCGPVWEDWQGKTVALPYSPS